MVSIFNEIVLGSTILTTTGLGVNVGIPQYALQISGLASIVNNTNNLLSLSGIFNNFQQINVQNFNNGFMASSDLVATNDIGNNNYYVDLGINSSLYTGEYIGATGDGYLYNAGNDFYVGNISPSGNLILFANNVPYTPNMGDIIINTTGIYLLSPTFLSGNPIITGINITTTTGLIIAGTKQSPTINTYFSQQFNSGLMLNTTMTSANTYYNAVSGNVGPGTWLVLSNVNVKCIAAAGMRVTAKLFSGAGAFFCGESSSIQSGTNITGFADIQLNGIINLTATTTPIVLACTSTTASCIITSAPTDNLTAGIPSGVSTYINMVRLY